MHCATAHQPSVRATWCAPWQWQVTQADDWCTVAEHAMVVFLEPFFNVGIQLFSTRVAKVRWEMPKLWLLGSGMRACELISA